MKAKAILTTEIDGLRISSLPSRPTAPAAFGGGGLSSKDMRAAFDKLSIFIINRYNELISDIESGELAASLIVDEEDGTTLKDVADLIKNGYAAFSLSAEISEIKERLCALEEKNNE